MCRNGVMVTYRIVPCGPAGQGGWAVERRTENAAPELLLHFATAAEAQAEADRLAGADGGAVA
jgi:putative component of membrane protein insertase Oxa1/YidC/SpoIIIJ protein YidD